MFLSSLKQYCSITGFGTTKLCTIVFRADSGRNREIFNFTYICLYTRPIKVVSVDNIIRKNHFYYFIKSISPHSNLFQ